MEDNFKWTDELVSDYVIDIFCHRKYGHSLENLEKFKKSKEIPDKDYEVLEIDCYKNERRKLIDEEYRLYVDGVGFTLDYLMNIANGKIHLVKRLPDNQQFQIGDHFMYKSRELSNEISEFLIVNGVMKVKAEGVLAPMELKFISKIDKPKVPLFTKAQIMKFLEEHL